MKFFLTIYICSVVTQNCAEVPFEKHDMIDFMIHTESVYKKDSVSLTLYCLMVSYLNRNVVNTMELYPKFMCEKTDNKEKPEA
jgi:hypothetical protein